MSELEKEIVNNGMRPKIDMEKENWDENYVLLIESCWGEIPSNRPTAKEIAVDLSKLREGNKDFSFKTRNSIEIIPENHFYEMSAFKKNKSLNIFKKKKNLKIQKKNSANVYELSSTPISQRSEMNTLDPIIQPRFSPKTPRKYEIIKELILPDDSEENSSSYFDD